MSLFEDETRKSRRSSRMNVLGPAESRVCATADCHEEVVLGRTCDVPGTSGVVCIAESLGI